MDGVRLHHISTGTHASVYVYRDAPRDASNAQNASRAVGEDDRLRVVKIVHAGPSGKRTGLKPHNVLKELWVLRRLDHPNIIKLLEYIYVPSRMEHHLTLPLLALTLRQLLDSCPSPSGDDQSSRARPELFRSIAYQLFQALDHLHTNAIAHRDVKPENIMLDFKGTIVLIDFSTSWDVKFPDEGDEWKEETNHMCCEVGTGPYRAPELLFSPRTYDAMRLDIWAAGCVLAEFFLPEDYLLDSDDPLDGTPGKGSAAHLFDSSFGDLGLAASIFRIRGSPTHTSWPGFADLPDAGKIAFEDSNGTSLESLLPDLHHSRHAPAILDMLERMLQLDPSSRPGASLLLQSPLFTCQPMPLPSGYASSLSDSPDAEEKVLPLRDLLELWLEGARRAYAHI